MTDQISSHSKQTVPLSHLGLPEENARLLEAQFAAATSPEIQFGGAIATLVVSVAFAIAGAVVLGALAIGQPFFRFLPVDVALGGAAVFIGIIRAYVTAKALRLMAAR